jgi:hypothetical protein
LKDFSPAKAKSSALVARIRLRALDTQPMKAELKDQAEAAQRAIEAIEIELGKFQNNPLVSAELLARLRDIQRQYTQLISSLVCVIGICK